MSDNDRNHRQPEELTHVQRKHERGARLDLLRNMRSPMNNSQPETLDDTIAQLREAAEQFHLLGMALILLGAAIGKTEHICNQGKIQ